MKFIEILITAMIVVFVVVIGIWFFTGAFNPILASLRGEGITSEQEIEYANNFEKILENIENCKNNVEGNCICEVFPNFPGTFKGKLSFVSSGNGVDMKLEIGGKEYYSSTLENTYIISFLFEEQTNFENIIAYDKDVYAEKWIDFTKNPPRLGNQGLGRTLFIGTSEPNVVSGMVFKDSTGILYFILSTKKPESVSFLIGDLPKCFES